MLNLFSWFSGRQYAFGAFIVALALLDPFGLTSSTDDASAKWLNRIFASFYPDTGQRNTVVILIDDEYLLSNDTYWPMPYSEQSKLFKRLLAYKPDAVFVDLLYSHDHSRDDARQSSQLLANVFERYKHQGIPLLLANTGLERGKDGQINTLPRFSGVTSPALVAWSGFGDHYPLAIRTAVGDLETPALELYRRYCQKNACEPLPEDAAAAISLPPIALQWGLKMSAKQSLVAPVGHCSTPGVIDQLLQAIFWKLGSEAESNCAYSLTLRAGDLEANGPEERELLSHLLRGKLVLVGAQIASAGDLVQSPLHGKVPGIYIHAMALDNLIAWGTDYYHSPANLFGSDIDWLDMVELALLLLIAVLKKAHERDTWSCAHWRSWHSWCVVLLLLATLSGVLHFMSITPANILGILLLSLVLFSDKLEEIVNASHRKGALPPATQGTQR